MKWIVVSIGILVALVALVVIVGSLLPVAHVATAGRTIVGDVQEYDLIARRRQLLRGG